MNNFEELRQLVFGHIKWCLTQSPHCKSYEGTFKIVYPGYFDTDYNIELACYLIGPTRSYSWSGKDIDECCDKAIADCKKWIQEDLEDNES